MAYTPPTAEDAAKWPGLIVPGGGGAAAPPSDATLPPPETQQNWPGLIVPPGTRPDQPLAPPPDGDQPLSLLGHVGRAIGDWASANAPDWAQNLSATAHGLAGLPSLLYDAAAVPQNLAAKGLRDAGVISPDTADLLIAKPAQQRVGEGLGAVGLPPEPDPTWANSVTEMVAGVPVGVGVGGAASRALTVVGKPIAAAVDSSLSSDAGSVPAFVRAKPTLQTIADTFADKPALQTAAAVGAGTAKQIAQDSWPDSPLAQTIAALGGGLAVGSAGAAAGAGLRALSGGGLSLLNPDTLAARAYFGAAGDPDAAIGKVIAYNRAPETPSGAEPPANLRTTAEVADDPGLYGGERSLRSGPYEQSGGFVTQNQQRQAARISALDQIAPAAGPNEYDVAMHLRENAQLAAAAGNTADQAASQGLSDARTGLGTPLMPEQAGAQLQANLAGRKTASSANVGALSDAVDPDGTTAIRTKPIKDAINDAADKEFGPNPDLRPGPVNDMLTRLASPTTTFDELQNMRSSSLRASQGAAWQSNPNIASVQSQAADAIRQQIEDAAGAGQGFSPDQLARWNDFRTAAAQHGADFGTDPVLDATATNYGRFDQGPTTIASNFFQPGEQGGDSMRSFNAAFTDRASGTLDPAADTAMRGYVAGRVGELFPPNGAPDPAAIGRFVANHAEAIRQLPQDFQQQLGSVQNAAQMVKQTGAATADSVEAANAGAAKLFLNGADPDRAMATALAGDNATANVADLMNRTSASPAASQGLKRAYINAYVNKFTGTSPIGAGDDLAQSQAKAQGFWDSTENARRLLFSPSEQGQLQAVNDDFLSGQKVSTVGKAAGSNTAQNLNNMTNARVLQAVVDGLPVPNFAKNIIGSVAQPTLGQMRGLNWILNGTSEATQARLYEMALDPNNAAMLLRQSSPEDLAALAGRVDDLRQYGPVGQTAIGVGRGLAAIGRAAAPTALRVGTQATGVDEPPTITVTAHRPR